MLRDSYPNGGEMELANTLAALRSEKQILSEDEHPMLCENERVEQNVESAQVTLTLTSLHMVTYTGRSASPTTRETSPLKAFTIGTTGILCTRRA